MVGLGSDSMSLACVGVGLGGRTALYFGATLQLRDMFAP